MGLPRCRGGNGEGVAGVEANRPDPDPIGGAERRGGGRGDRAGGSGGWAVAGEAGAGGVGGRVTGGGRGLVMGLVGDVGWGGGEHPILQRKFSAE